MYGVALWSRPAGVPSPKAQTPATRGPDYAALVTILGRLRRLPDAAGETRLSRSEAAQIRACGFEARAGSIWRCPLLPDELVSGNRLLAHLSEKADPFWRPRNWNPKRAAVRTIAPIDPLSKRERQLIRLLRNGPNQRLSRRDLQRRVSRWAPSRFLDHMLNRLSREDYITLHDGAIYPFSRAEFESIQRQERQPRFMQFGPRNQ